MMAAEQWKDEQKTTPVKVASTLTKMLEMIRFSHTVFALPFALLAAAMAWAAEVPAWAATVPEGASVQFRVLDLVAILICMVGARSAAMAFNRLTDRFIDGENPRTAGRHLPAGQLSVVSVVVFTILSTLLFFGGLCLFLPNYLPLAVSPVVLVVLFGYSYAKRFTSLAHFWLGVALMLAPVCAWLAIRGLIVATDVTDLVPSVILGVGILFWVAGFDIIYACQDYEYDRQKKLNSVPVRLGIVGALRLAAVCHALAVLAFLALPLLDGYVGPELGLGWVFLAAGVAVAGLLIYEHSIVSAKDLTRVNVAFFNVNAVISIGLLAVGLLDLFVV